MSVNKTRGFLYQLAKFLGDFQALSSGNPGKVGKRIARRTAGKAVGKGFRKLLK